MPNAEWMRRDLAHVWHPCTQMHDHEQLPLIPIRSARGLWLHDFEGHRYLDAVSSWWVNIFGHGHPYIDAQIKAQLDELAHIMIAGFTHAPLVELSERLVARAPAGLTRCFYADNGASAIEVALKMSQHAWRHQGRPEKHRFLSLRHAYHGETLGALGVTDIPLFSSTYAPLLHQALHVAGPDCRGLPPEQWQEHSRQAFAAMEEALCEHADELAAVIVEPLVQGAAGMLMYHPIYLSLLREACDRHGVHLICDEIAVGFGRTGTFFACEQAQISPDFLCLSKALTAGYLPMSVVMVQDALYALFYDRFETLKGFLHSHSYTGNALAARAALASLDLFDQLDVLAGNQRRAARMAEHGRHLATRPHVAHLRQTGMILAFDLVDAQGQPYDWRERRGLLLHRAAREREVLLRPIGNTVYIMPPYIIEDADIDLIFAVLEESVAIASAADAGPGHDTSIALP